MCGICGVYNYRHDRPAERPLIESMCKQMELRGPDDEGILMDGPLGIGMRRLSIIDLPGGAQPMRNEDGSAHIVFNGEIFNYVELREQLISRGHTLQTHSDTEVIIHLYEDYGAGCLKHLRGMFAFCIWDKRTKSVFAARDRMGIKPFYYNDSDGRLLFASEMKSILCESRLSREIDRTALDHFLSLRYVPAPRTILESVNKLPAGHYLTCSNEKGLRIEKYWDLEFKTTPRSEQEAAEELENLIEESIRLRLRSDVPLGVFLSGGLDSSAITAIAARNATGRLKTFSIGFEGDAFNEFKYSRMVAKTFDTDHHELTLEPLQFAEFFPDFIRHQDEPLADPASIPLYFIAKWARRSVKVALSGEGADEVFGGYSRYDVAAKQFAAADQWRKSRGFMGAATPFLDRIIGLAADNARLRNIADEPSRHYLQYALCFSDARKNKLYTPEFAEHLGGNDVASIYNELFNENSGADSLQQMLYTDWKTWLPEDLLMKADKMTMANSLELRVPLLDHVLVEYAATLPSYLKVRDGSTKYIFKKAVGESLPDEIINRTKLGFPVPLGAWFQSDLKNFAREILCDSKTTASGLFEPKELDNLLREHELRHADQSGKIWNLLCFEQWRRCFV